MTKSREAKKLLANVLRSPGRIRAGYTVISVDCHRRAHARRLVMGAHKKRQLL